MIYIYDVVAERHRGSSQSDVVLYYDEDKGKAINYMETYRKKHGFSIDEKEGTFSIADIILRKRKPTGEEISRTSYGELFDVYGKRLVN